MSTSPNLDVGPPAAWKHRAPLAAVVAIVVCGLLAIGSTAAAAAAGAAGKGGHLRLTGLVTKEHTGSRGSRVKIVLEKGKKDVGKISFPSCEGAGASVLCSGTVSVKGLGSGLMTSVDFECGVTPPFKCDPGAGPLSTKGGETVGTISLHVQPSKLKIGAKFPVIVTKSSGA